MLCAYRFHFVNWNLTGSPRGQCVPVWTIVDTLLGTARYRFESKNYDFLGMYTRRERPMCRSEGNDDAAVPMIENGRLTVRAERHIGRSLQIYF